MPFCLAARPIGESIRPLIGRYATRELSRQYAPGNCRGASSNPWQLAPGHSTKLDASGSGARRRLATAGTGRHILGLTQVTRRRHRRITLGDLTARARPIASSDRSEACDARKRRGLKLSIKLFPVGGGIRDAGGEVHRGVRRPSGVSGRSRSRHRYPSPATFARSTSCSHPSGPGLPRRSSPACPTCRRRSGPPSSRLATLRRRDCSLSSPVPTPTATPWHQPAQRYLAR